jgi:hypothetical protein
MLEYTSLPDATPRRHAATILGIKLSHHVLVGNLRERENLGDPVIDGRLILRWIFRKWNVGYGPDRAGLGWGQVAGACECGNDPWCPIKCGEFLD